MIELESVEALREHARRHGHLRGVAVQGLDLRGESELLLRLPAEGAVFLGCLLEPPVVDHLCHGGALLFPRLPGLPYHPYRPRLYTPGELYEGFDPARPESLGETLDARIYRHFSRHRGAPGPLPILEALGQRLHDHAIDDALYELLEDGPRRVVGLMGGHALRRGSPAYERAALLGRALAREGYFLATGGGPGAMEAANLGAWLAPLPDDALGHALERLARHPEPERDPAGFLAAALELRHELGVGGESLGIPTWFYGHEPTNPFASHVAKYFSNSIREDTLLAIAVHGVIFTPGSAGTLQEVFMEVTQNHYGTFRWVSPMVFLGREFWERARPVQPLLDALAGHRQWREMFALLDTVEEAVAFLRDHPPVPYEPA